MPRDRMRAQVKFRRHTGTDGARFQAKVPAAVRDFLEVRPEDNLVFEEGSTFVAERAAARGRYCVVYVERAAAENGEAAPVVQSEPPPRPSLTESLQETIQRLRNERP
jgi:hypothetical protein